MALLRCWMAGMMLVLGAGVQAQEPLVDGPVAGRLVAPGTAEARSVDLRPALAGVNAAVTFAGVHDSSIGWYTVVTPNVSISFSRRYSADVSVSVYPDRQAPNDAGQLTQVHGDVGDTLLGVNANFFPRGTQNTTTFVVSLPTGKQADGLGTGTVTVDLSNHSERYFGHKGVLLDVGLGDTAGLFNRLMANQDSTLAPIAHFQTGAIAPLPWRSYLQTTAYEQLPLGDQKMYSTYQERGRRSLTLATGRKVAEDNGFANVLTVPVSRNVVFSAVYTRSLRLHLDTVSMGVTYSLRGWGQRRDALIDKALAEAERVR